MHSPHIQCDSARLQSYLQGAVDSEETQSIELHLDGCARCREQIQLLAADNEFWTVATSSLETLRTREDDIPPLTVASCLNAIEQGLLEAAVQNEVEDGTHRYLRPWLGPAEADDSLGSLNEYEVLSIVGSGGMGLVLKARDGSLGRLVAIKTLRQHLTGELSARRRFAREAQVAASLRHHNIVDIYTVKVWRDIPCFVMPFVQQGTLLDFKRAMQGRVFTLDETLSMAQQIASGLAAAHRHGMMHRAERYQAVEHSHRQWTRADTHRRLWLGAVDPTSQLPAGCTQAHAPRSRAEASRAGCRK